MNRLIQIFALAALAACSSDSGEHSDSADAPQVAHDESAVVLSDEEQIKESFRALQNACLARDGASAHRYFAQATRNRWVHMKGLALNADKSTLRREGLMVQLGVLVLRAKAGFEVLESLDEVGVIQYALENNLLGNQMVAGNSLVDIEIDGDHAVSGATHPNAGRLEMRYGFAREDDLWRVDLSTAYEMANEILAARWGEIGVEGDEERLYFLVGNATGTLGTEALWTPLSDLVGR